MGNVLQKRSEAFLNSARFHRLVRFDSINTGRFSLFPIERKVA
jgi:hypothetical protein